MSGATAAFLDYLGAKRPELPRIQLYFELSGTVVAAAGKYDLISDWYVVEDVVREVELRLGECYVANVSQAADPILCGMGPRDQMIGRRVLARRRPRADVGRRPLSSPHMSDNRHTSSSLRRLRGRERAGRPRAAGHRLSGPGWGPDRAAHDLGEPCPACRHAR